ncbi:MAG: response regulator [Phycisphaerae bacterium]
MPTHDRPRVLVVEDEPDMNNLLADVLRAFDFEPVQAADGREALQCVEQQPPDAVILDLMLPVIGGYEVCRRLKTSRATCRIPVLILTALDREPKRRTAYRTGADEYLTKPFAPDALIQRLQACLEEARRATDAQAGQVRLTVEPSGALDDLKGPNALARALYERTDLASETIETLREHLLDLVEDAGDLACECGGSRLVRITMTVEANRLRVTVDPLAPAAERFLNEHLGPDAAAATALVDAGAVDRVRREGGSVVMEKALGDG